MDVKIAWDTAHFRGDWAIAAGGLAVDGGIRTAVMVSLFTDARAPDSFVPTDGTTDRRGWWGDTYSVQPWGSLLWTLNRAKKTDSRAMLNIAADMCRASMKWLLDGGYVASVAVQTAWITPQAMGIQVSVSMPNGTPQQPFRFAWAWETNTLVPARDFTPPYQWLLSGDGKPVLDGHGNPVLTP